MLKEIKHLKIKLWWKLRNRHNKTRINLIDYNKEKGQLIKNNAIIVGDETYGYINVMMFNADCRMKIGNYCSISRNVLFILGGEHNYKRFSTYPFTYRCTGLDDSLAKGNIIIGDDVWIGEGATILSGVNIGQGAIIGACSVVTKDIPPYAIVGGNPARIIKYRFSHETIDELVQLNFDNIIINNKNLNYYSKEITTPKDVDEILKNIY